MNEQVSYAYDSVQSFLAAEAKKAKKRKKYTVVSCYRVHNLGIKCEVCNDKGYYIKLDYVL